MIITLRKTSGMIALSGKDIIIMNRSEGHFDWYVGWEELKSTISKYIKEESKILIVGCGNSSKYIHQNIILELSESMYNSSYKDITNIDISDVVIKKMTEMYKEKCQEMQCI